MRERMKLRDKLTYANVMVTILAFIVLGGGAAFAALGKNTVGTRQLKRNAVTKVKIKKNSVNGPRVKNNSLTGADIKLSKLGTVPAAKSADTAGSANTANVANAANSANSLAPAEGWHEIGAPGEPGFENSWANSPPSEAGVNFETAAFYKDHEGIVHLKGLVGGGTSSLIFHLPPGYRPANGKVLARLTLCAGCAEPIGLMLIAGSGIPVPGFDGLVTAPGGAEATSLEGITFRAES